MGRCVKFGNALRATKATLALYGPLRGIWLFGIGHGSIATVFIYKKSAIVHNANLKIALFGQSAISARGLQISAPR
jgi:hypothetical protein